MMNLTNLSYLKLHNNNLINTEYEANLIIWLDQHQYNWRTQNSPSYCSTSLLQFSATNYNVNEGDNTTTITVTRTESKDGAVSIDYATSDDTAKALDRF
ncbi:MAG: Calx-beta domain-containing protein [Pseudomonadota bacterium]